MGFHPFQQMFGDQRGAFSLKDTVGILFAGRDVLAIHRLHRFGNLFADGGFAPSPFDLVAGNPASQTFFFRGIQKERVIEKLAQIWITEDQNAFDEQKGAGFKCLVSFARVCIAKS